MKNRDQYEQGLFPDPEADETGPYDAAPAEADLWFLPGPDTEEDADPLAPPLPRAPRTSLVDLAAWRAAEAALAGARPQEHNAFKVPLAKQTLIRALLETQRMEI